MVNIDNCNQKPMFILKNPKALFRHFNTLVDIGEKDSLASGNVNI